MYVENVNYKRTIIKIQKEYKNNTKSIHVRLQLGANDRHNSRRAYVWSPETT